MNIDVRETLRERYMTDSLSIRQYQPDDRDDVVALWSDVLADSQPWNAPEEIIRRKLLANDGLFFVGELDGRVVATTLAGYDGVRGWIYSVAVDRSLQGRGVGRRMMQAAEEALRERGCPKINLQVRSTNDRVVAFYEALGYRTEDRISLGKPLGP